MGKLEQKRQIGRSSFGMGYNIKMDYKKVWWRDGDGFDLAQNMDRFRAFVNIVINVS
jgi:hypothetical protein